LKQALKRQGFCGNDVVLAAPEDKLLRGVFELPHRVSGPALAQVVRMEMSRTHGVAPDSFEMVWWEPPGSDKSKSIIQTIVLGCPHSVADPLLDVFEESGFNVRALDTSTAAATRACSCLTLPPPDVTCILDFGWSSTKLLLVCSGTVIYERPLEETRMAHLVSRLTEKFSVNEESACQLIGTIGFTATADSNELDQQSVEAIRKILSSHFDALLEELKAPFVYASRQYPGSGVKRLLLIGGGARISGLPQYLQQALNVEVMYAAPSDLLAGCDLMRTKAGNPVATVALGLAEFNGA
jgi:Tfp pilus assembly PilM family ATPase